MKKINNNLIFALSFVAIALLIMGLLSFNVSADPPSPQNVFGRIINNNSQGAGNGVPVLVNNTNLLQMFYTQVFAPPVPILAGAYSLTINGSIGDVVVVRAYNSSHYGSTQSTISGSSEINVTLNVSRGSETNVTITSPANNSLFNTSKKFNVTVNFNTLIKNGLNCNVTLLVSDENVVNFPVGTNRTNSLGNLSVGVGATTTFEMYANLDGVVNITAVGKCSTDDINFMGLNVDLLENVTIQDVDPPNVSLIIPLDSVFYNVGQFNFTYYAYDINLDYCTLYTNFSGLFLPYDVQISPINGNNNSFNNIYVDNGFYKWNVKCWDTKGNGGFAPNNFTLNITGPDLSLSVGSVYFGNEDVVEGNNITVYANITNVGVLNLNESFYVKFFLGDPALSGIPISADLLVQNLSSGSSIIIGINHTLITGNNNIFVLVDYYATVNETNENNNKLNNSVRVDTYQYYYGNFLSSLVLGNSGGGALRTFSNNTKTGNIYFSDLDSYFSFSDLVPLTRNSLGGFVSDDFTELDFMLGTSSFDDSIKQLWGGGSDVPLKTTSFNISGSMLTNVPVANSTNSSYFITGIFWDSADDSGNLQFDLTDAEDIVFVTIINASTYGKYGLYDYEIRVPASLRTYVAGEDKIVLYYEII